MDQKFDRSPITCYIQLRFCLRLSLVSDIQALKISGSRRQPVGETRHGMEAGADRPVFVRAVRPRNWSTECLWSLTGWCRFGGVGDRGLEVRFLGLTCCS